jgi:hypothetical protein
MRTATEIHRVQWERRFRGPRAPATKLIRRPSKSDHLISCVVVALFPTVDERAP